jgi:hypothetical protein
MLVNLRILVMVAVALAGCGQSQVPAEPAVGQRVADAFLAQVQAGQLNAAWQSTTAEFKSDEGRESFIRDVKARPLLRGPLNFVSYDVTDLNGLKRGQCIYESAAAGKKAPAARVRVVVAQDTGEWRVEGLFFE